MVSSASKKQNSVTKQQSSTKPPLAKNRKIKKKLSTTMVEAMFEPSPNYFKQFQKQFKILIVDEKPSFSVRNFYAVCAHFDFEFCNLVKSHYHVLIDTTPFENDTLKGYQSYHVPCVYIAIKFLFCTAPSLETNGDVFSKLILAIEFNFSAEKTDSRSVRK